MCLVISWRVLIFVIVLCVGRNKIVFVLRYNCVTPYTYLLIAPGRKPCSTSFSPAEHQVFLFLFLIPRMTRFFASAMLVRSSTTMFISMVIRSCLYLCTRWSGKICPELCFHFTASQPAISSISWRWTEVSFAYLFTWNLDFTILFFYCSFFYFKNEGRIQHKLGGGI